MEPTRLLASTDEFGTDAIRARVLDAWAASPARFREDANAEEDAALGAYRDRLVVELLQNAVDAAAAAGVPGRVLIRLRSGGPQAAPGAGPGGLLEVANTGAPLTAAGVEALSTLRASAKREPTAIGRFGAGFAAVLAVSDEPWIVSRAVTDTGAVPAARAGGGWSAVHWSKARTMAAVSAIGAAGLRDEVERRAGAVPVLRLPFAGLPDSLAALAADTAEGAVPAEARPPAGYDTVVRLPLRDADAAATARELVRGLDPTLPLVLPGLAEIVVDVDGEVSTHTCVWEAGPLAGPAAAGAAGAASAGSALGGPVLPDGVLPEDLIPDSVAPGSLVPDEVTSGGAGPGAAAGARAGFPAGVPGRIDVEIAVVDGVRWRGCVQRGTIPAELLADRPVEERARTGYAARAMFPEGGWPAGVARVIRAPQPTDEPISLPVLVSVELPLEPSRRHTVPGPLRDWLTDRLAEAVVALACHLGAQAPDLSSAPRGAGAPGGQAALSRDGGPSAADPLELALAALELVPTGLPLGEVDGRLRDRLLALLPDAPMLPGGRRGRECVVCDLGPATDGVTALLGAPHGSLVSAAARPSGEPAGPRLDPDLDPDTVLFSAGAPGVAEVDADTADVDTADGTRPGAGAVVDGLLPASFAARRWRPALDLLGVRRLDSAGVVEVLAGLRRPPHWWAQLYPLLMTAPDRDALGALPVPVVVVPELDEPAEPAESGAAMDGGGTDTGGTDTGGTDTGGTAAETAFAASGQASGGAPLLARMVTGPRGALLPTPELDIVTLARSGLPLRVVHPDACTGAARDALRTLGALEGTPGSVLRDPAVREAVTRSDPEDDPHELTTLANAVLALVRGALGDPGAGRPDGEAGADEGGQAGGQAGETLATGAGGHPVPMPSWLGELLLPEQDGGFAPACELIVAGGPLDRVLAEDAPFGVLDPQVAAAWPAPVLTAVGVLSTFAVLRASDVTLDPDEPVLLELDDSDTWVEEVYESEPAEPAGPPGTPAAPRIIRSFAAVRDLELVDRACWPEALAELARPPLRDVVCAPEPNYTRWWLSRHALLPVDEGGPGSGAGTLLPPPELRLPGADPLLEGLFAPAAPLPGVDDELLRALGCRLTLEDVLGDPDAVMDLLDRLGDADREVSWPAARTLYMAAVDAAAAWALAHPERRLDPPLTIRTPDGVFPSSEVVVVDAPDLLGLLGRGRSGLRLPLDRAAEAAHVLGLPLASELGDCEPVEGEPVEGKPQEAAAPTPAVAPDGTEYLVHRELWVTDLDGTPTRVGWRVLGGIGGEIHVDAEAGTDALARALAWRAGQWERRHALAAALRDPEGAAQRAAEDDLDEM